MVTKIINMILDVSGRTVTKELSNFLANGISSNTKYKMKNYMKGIELIV